MRNITDWADVPEVFDIPYMARLMGVTPEGVKKQCQRGDLPAFKFGKLWRFHKEDVREYIRERSAYKAGAAK